MNKHTIPTFQAPAEIIT